MYFTHEIHSNPLHTCGNIIYATSGNIILCHRFSIHMALEYTNNILSCGMEYFQQIFFCSLGQIHLHIAHCLLLPLASLLPLGFNLSIQKISQLHLLAYPCTCKPTLCMLLCLWRLKLEASYYVSLKLRVGTQDGKMFFPLYTCK